MPRSVHAAVRGVDEVHHLAFVNGTEFFYSAPELVLDVGVKGMVNVIDACRAAGVGRLVLASSSEVYQTPPQVPTDESAPLVVPDPANPRYSYGGGKIISELMAINYGRKFFERVLIFRPHNVYGPDMGFEHVIPQFALRLKRAAAQHTSGKVPFEIQGDGRQTRSFCHVDDLVRGVMVMRAKGEHLGIYHIGTTEEVTIADRRRGASRPMPAARSSSSAGPAPAGGTERRCPDIGKLAELGYAPQVPLAQGPAADRGLVLGQRTPCAESLIHCITGAAKETSACSQQKSPAPPAAAAAFRSKPARCAGTSKLETVLSLGYMPPVNQMVPIGEVPRQLPWFPTDAALLRQLRTGAARSRGRSGDHLPAGISLHQRHDQAPARQFRRALCRSPPRCSASARTISSSTSARTTAR